jgi:hypothetical protein
MQQLQLPDLLPPAAASVCLLVAGHQYFWAKGNGDLVRESAEWRFSVFEFLLNFFKNYSPKYSAASPVAGWCVYNNKYR